MQKKGFDRVRFPRRTPVARAPGPHTADPRTPDPRTPGPVLAVGVGKRQAPQRGFGGYGKQARG